MKNDPYKIPLKTAQDWCSNWINLKEKEESLNENEKYKPKDMRAFLVAREDLLDLFDQAPDANFVRFYIGLQEDGTKKIPHLLMVNAEGESPATAKDLISDDAGDDAALVENPVNDFSHPCPNTCDQSSALYVP